MEGHIIIYFIYLDYFYLFIILGYLIILIYSNFYSLEIDRCPFNWFLINIILMNLNCQTPYFVYFLNNLFYC